MGRKLLFSTQFIPQDEQSYIRWSLPYNSQNFNPLQLSFQVRANIQLLDESDQNAQPILIVKFQNDINEEPSLLKQLIDQRINLYQSSSKLEFFNRKGSIIFGVDRIGYITRSKDQFISYPYPQDNQQNIYIQVRDLGKPNAPLIPAKIEITQGDNKFECYKYCGDYGKCEVWKYWMETENSLERQCQCDNGYFGFGCQDSYQNISVESSYNFQKYDNRWQSFAMEAKVNKDYKIYLQKLTPGSYVSFLLLGSVNYLQQPNFFFHSQLVKGSKFTISEVTKSRLSDYIQSMKLQGQTPLILISIYSPQNKNAPSYGNIKAVYKAEETNYFPATVIIAIVLVSLICCICLCNCVLKLKYMKQNENREQQAQQANGQEANQNSQVVNVQNQHGNVRIKKIFVIITQQTIDKYMPDTSYKFLIQNLDMLKEESQECTVCLCEFEPEERCRITICFHIFHKECIDSWIKKHGTCPCCRHKLVRKVFEDQETLRKEFESNAYMQKIQNSINAKQFELEDSKGEEIINNAQQKQKEKKEQEDQKEQDIEKIQKQINGIYTSENEDNPLRHLEEVTQSLNPLKYMKGFSFLFTPISSPNQNLLMDKLPVESDSICQLEGKNGLLDLDDRDTQENNQIDQIGAINQQHLQQLQCSATNRSRINSGMGLLNNDGLLTRSRQLSNSSNGSASMNQSPNLLINKYGARESNPSQFQLRSQGLQFNDSILSVNQQEEIDFDTNNQIKTETNENKDYQRTIKKRYSGFQISHNMEDFTQKQGVNKNKQEEEEEEQEEQKQNQNIKTQQNKIRFSNENNQLNKKKVEEEEEEEQEEKNNQITQELFATTNDRINQIKNENLQDSTSTNRQISPNQDEGNIFFRNSPINSDSKPDNSQEEQE